MIYKRIRELQGETALRNARSDLNPPAISIWAAHVPARRPGADSRAGWLLLAELCRRPSGSPRRLLPHAWALCPRPTFQGGSAVILVSLKPPGCKLWPSAAHRRFHRPCGRASSRSRRCCPSPYKLPLLRSQWQGSWVGSWSPCQLP